MPNCPPYEKFYDDKWSLRATRICFWWFVFVQRGHLRQTPNQKIQTFGIEKKFLEKIVFLEKKFLTHPCLLVFMLSMCLWVPPLNKNEFTWNVFARKRKKFHNCSKRPKMRKRTLLGMHNQPEPRRQNNKEGPQVESWSTSLSSKKKTLWYFGWRDWNLGQLIEKRMS